MLPVMNGLENARTSAAPPARPRRAATLALLSMAGACLLLPLPGVVALVAGGAFAAFVGAPGGSARASQWLLQGSVVALGAGIDLALVVRAGIDGLGSAAVTLVVALLVGALLARWFRIERDAAWLITVGTAICGGSAIAAAAPVLRAKPGAVGIAIGVVFLLNAVALLLFPWLGDALGLSATQFGEWCALAIHDTSSVVGAAATRGSEALELATAMKLGRSLWIVPVCVALAFVPSASGATAGRAAPAPRVWPRPPLFVVAFVAIAALVALLPALAPAGRVVAEAGRRGLTLGLFVVGLSLDRDALRALRLRHLGLGVALWAVLAVVALALVRS